MVSIRVVPEDGWVRFEVADTGPGVPPEHLPYVFDPFSPAGRDRGAGLGLAISKTIVEEIGGHIEAENRPTGGGLSCTSPPSTRGTPPPHSAPSTPRARGPRLCGGPT